MKKLLNFLTVAAILLIIGAYIYDQMFVEQQTEIISRTDCPYTEVIIHEMEFDLIMSYEKIGMADFVLTDTYAATENQKYMMNAITGSERGFSVPSNGSEYYYGTARQMGSAIIMEHEHYNESVMLFVDQDCMPDSLVHIITESPGYVYKDVYYPY